MVALAVFFAFVFACALFMVWFYYHIEGIFRECRQLQIDLLEVRMNFGVRGPRGGRYTGPNADHK